MNKEELYVCVNDRQGGEFAVGCIGDWKDWQKIALEWADSDDAIYLIKTLKRLRGEQLIYFVDETWDIDIRKVE